MSIKTRVTSVVVTKITKLVVSSIIRAITHPLDHAKWCKEHPKQMEMVNRISKDVGEQASTQGS